MGQWTVLDIFFGFNLEYDEHTVTTKKKGKICWLLFGEKTKQNANSNMLKKKPTNATFQDTC